MVISEKQEEAKDFMYSVRPSKLMVWQLYTSARGFCLLLNNIHAVEMIAF